MLFLRLFLRTQHHTTYSLHAGQDTQNTTWSGYHVEIVRGMESQTDSVMQWIPSEKLATLVTKIITPLLDFIPCHLKNIHEHLEIFKRINPNELSGLRFYTADVSALFTNVSVNSCIEDVIELAAEYWADIQTYGLEIVDLHRLLEIVLGSSYFKFNGRLYNQIYGGFIGCAASPPCAIIKLYKLEKESIYTDAYYLTNPVRLFYGLYVDDSGSFVTSHFGGHYTEL